QKYQGSKTSRSLRKSLPFVTKQLQAFLAVVDHGSLRSAADVLSVSPAAVSSALAGLQRTVGVPLIEREGRGVKPTAAGLAFAGDVRRMLVLSTASIATAKSAMQTESPPLRISAPSAASEAFLGDLIAKFMVRFPSVRISFEASAREQLWGLIEERKIDVGFAQVAPDRRTLQSLAIRENPFVVVGTRATRYSKAALAQSVWLIREPGSGTRDVTEQFLRDYDIKPELRMIGSSSTIIRCIREGVGVSIIERDLVRSDLEAGTMSIVRTPFTPRTRPWYFIVAADRSLPGDVNKFLDFAIQSKVFSEPTRALSS
ncbi:MAG: LysR family transcriptional regulator, partial [Vulcanimicrobiaceae bacterium]